MRRKIAANKPALSRAAKKAAEQLNTTITGRKKSEPNLQTIPVKEPARALLGTNAILSKDGEVFTSIPVEPVVDSFKCSDIPTDPTYSSTIAGANYDPASKLMVVAFRKKGGPDQLYFYDGSTLPPLVPSAGLEFPLIIWQQFKAARSKGSFFQAVIAKTFKGVKCE